MNNQLKRIRMSKGITQTELAKISGVSRSIINQLECGSKDVITSKTMLKLSVALEAPIEDIFLSNQFNTVN